MSLNILVVDDSPVSRAIVKKAISMSGLEIGTLAEATDGAEGLSKLEGTWFDIVFTDLNMPVMTGWEMVEKMAAASLLDSIPVVVISSDRSKERMAALEARGVRAYLNKPFRPEQFREIVTQLLGTCGEQSNGTTDF